MNNCFAWHRILCCDVVVWFPCFYCSHLICHLSTKMQRQKWRLSELLEWRHATSLTSSHTTTTTDNYAATISSAQALIHRTPINTRTHELGIEYGIINRRALWPGVAHGERIKWRRCRSQLLSKWIGLEHCKTHWWVGRAKLPCWLICNTIISAANGWCY